MLNRSDIWRSRDSLCLQRYEDSLISRSQIVKIVYGPVDARLLAQRSQTASVL